MEVFKATKSRFALRFLRFARDNLKFAQKFKPNRGLQIDFTRPCAETRVEFGAFTF